MIPDKNVLRQTRAGLVAQLEQLDRDAGQRNLNPSEQGRWDRLTAQVREIDADLEQAGAARVRQDDAMRRQIEAHGAAYVGRPGASGGSDPWAVDVRAESPAGLISRAHDVLNRSDDLSHSGREALAECIDGQHGAGAAAFLLARSHPDYLSAFGKLLTTPETAFHRFTPQEAAAFDAVESVRASLSTNVGTAGYSVPVSLDPNLAAITSAGVTNPLRKHARHKVATSSPYRALTSAGVTAAWIPEGSAFSDNSPTLGKVDIDLHKLGAWITGTYEVIQDTAADLQQMLPVLLADARDKAEADGFVLGSGSGAPKGIVTALAAGSAFVTATTRGSFTSASSGDIVAMVNALGPRARASKSTAWLMNNTTLNVVRQQVIGTAGSLLTDIDTGNGLLGYPVYEASAMTDSTTSGSYLAVLADLSAYCVVDHVAGPALEYVQNVVDGDGKPLGVRGWLYHARTGGDALDVGQGKILKA